MAQIRMRDYREPLASFEHNIMQLRNSAGRFKGFDSLNIVGTLDFNLFHSLTGFIFKDQSYNTIGPCGEVQTKQGVFIIETSGVGPFTIDTNAGNTNDRIDLIVCNHQYVSVTGGSPATYSIIKGPISSNTPPPLTNDDFQTIIGRIIMPAGATDINQATYIKERSPDSGDGLDARINEINKFNTLNQYNFSDTVYNSNSYFTNIGGAICWTLNPDGNVFDVSLGAVANMDALRIGKEPVQNGTEITIRTNSMLTVRSNVPLPAGAVALGYSNFVITEQYANRMVAIGAGRGMAIIPTTLAGRWSLTFLKAVDQWVLVSVQSHEPLSFKRGMIIDAYLDSQELADNFDGTGKGINLYTGWAMCNGDNNTIDMRGRFTMMTTDVPNGNSIPLEGGIDPIGINQAGGANRVTLSASEIPAHRHHVSGSNFGSNSGGGAIPATSPSDYENAGYTDIDGGGGGSHENRPAFKTLYKIQRII